MTQVNTAPRLKQEVGLFGAVMLGLGSIIGTGVFVSIGLAAGIAGPSVVLAVALAAGVATCNGLSSAQLAAAHPVSGGTYEYGYKYLNPQFGFTAGWMFLLAKSASAATAALGFGGYLLSALGRPDDYLVPLALVMVVIFTLVVLSGLRRSNFTNVVIVSITLLSLLYFVASGMPRAINIGATNFTPFFSGENPLASLFHAAALMFVAYTGYGRIATLGEEVREPQRTIPRAIIVTMLVTMALYLTVAAVGVGAAGSETLGSAAQTQPAPLAVAAGQFGPAFGPSVLAFGAVTAMLGVLLNLILGLSRVLLAMGRRRDMPVIFSRLNQTETTPVPAVIAVGAFIAALTLIGDVKTTWSFSAFTVLIYYALTNLAALRLPEDERLYPKWVAWLGLAACLFLAFWVEWQAWLLGLGLIALGLLWHSVARRYNPAT